MAIVTNDQLIQFISSTLAPPRQEPQGTGQEHRQDFDVPSWAAVHGVVLTREEKDDRSTKYEVTCPWCGNGGAAIMREPNGKIAYKCFHSSNGCSSKTWFDFRNHYEPDYAVRKKKFAGRQASALSAAKTAGAEPLDGMDGSCHLTDMGNAERFAKLHRGKIFWTHHWKRWLCWDGRVWSRDSETLTIAMAKDAVRGIYAEAALQAGTAERKAVADWAKRSESSARVNSMLDLARGEPEMSIDTGRLDQQPDLFNTPNGVIDLRSGRLLPHSPHFLMTRLGGIQYCPDAGCPWFLSFLDTIFQGNEEMAQFMQRLMGYCLTGRTDERALVINHGQGRNGKSTLQKIMAGIMGGYAKRVPVTLIVDTRNQSAIPNDIAALFGLRWAYTSESKDGARLDEGKVKDITGGSEKLSGCFKFEEFFEFVPTHKLWLGTNHIPEIRGTDDAIWDRMLLVPFKHRFVRREECTAGQWAQTPETHKAKPESEVDAAIAKELPGIFAWAVKGAALWYKDGLMKPAEVLRDTGQYRNDQDIAGRFVAERCSVHHILKSSAKELYAAYEGWADMNGEPVMSQRNFSARLTEKGFKKSLTDGRTFWCGLKANSENIVQYC